MTCTVEFSVCDYPSDGSRLFTSLQLMRPERVSFREDETAVTVITPRPPVEVDTQWRRRRRRHSLRAFSALPIEPPQEPASPRESFRGRYSISLERVFVRKNQVRTRRSWSGDNDGEAVGAFDPDAVPLVNE